jgi:adenine phosphoribosyltransferase
VSIKTHIRTIDDYPKPGIVFRDITTLLKNGGAFRDTISELASRYAGHRLDKVAGIESRGFIIGSALAFQLGIGFVPIRKKGKLPGATFGHAYEMEYGRDHIEIHTDAVATDERILLVDDLIATGGTAVAATKLIEKAGGQVIECCFVIDLPDLGGGERLRKEHGHAVFALCTFDGH